MGIVGWMSILGIFVAIVGIYIGWWSPINARVRGAIRDNAPQVWFKVLILGGHGDRELILRIHMERSIPNNLSFYLPGTTDPVWRAPTISPQQTGHPLNIRLDDSMPIFNRQLNELKARLVFRDSFGFQYVVSCDLPLQRLRTDGSYGIDGSREGLLVEHPIIRLWDVWRLKDQV